MNNHTQRYNRGGGGNWSGNNRGGGRGGGNRGNWRGGATIDIMDTTVEEVVTTTEIKDSITEITTGVITGITTQTEVCQATNPEVAKAIHV